MAALQFTITSAGLSLLSQVSTIGPVTLTKVAIGSGAFTPSTSVSALQTQIKQITPSGSNVPAPGIIHITAQDSSTDAYSVKEIGIYAGTTLFAYYSQSTTILSKASANVALFSIDLALTNVPAGSVTIGSATFAYPPATETTQGVAEIATTAEVTAGTDDTRIVTPLKLAAGFVKKSGDTMTGPLVLPSLTAQKANGSGTSTMVFDPNAAGSGNAALGVTGALYFYIGTNDLQTTGFITNGTPRLVVNPNGTIDAKTNQIYNVASVALLADPSLPAHAATKNYIDSMLVGAVMAFSMSSAPTGWIKANGAAISRTVYASLFGAIGTFYGAGDGSTTFNLPDLRGEFLRGWDDGRGVDSGRAFGSYQADELKSHRHNTRILRDRSPVTAGNAVLGDEDYYGTQENWSEYTGGTETRPRNRALLFCIKY